MKRGIGIYYGGLFFILKEIIEIFFFEGLIKVLFVMEIFVMGINMLVRIVLFINVCKFDGKDF